MNLYEYPFSELIRTCLRLEHLFDRLDELVAGEMVAGHHFALVTIFDIIEICNRPDLKSYVLNELEKQKTHVSSFRGNPAVSEEMLESTLHQLGRAFSELSRQQGKPGRELITNDWLMAIRGRLAIPGGTSAVDLPAYFTWQQREAGARRADLLRWSTSLRPMEMAVRLLLHMLRSTGTGQMMVAQGGRLQLKLPRDRSTQLLRLEMDAMRGLVPEVSGNQLMAVIRMMHPTEQGGLHAVNVDTPVKLTLCS